MAISNKEYSEITCESCGKDFSCGASGGSCWCFEIKLEPNTLADLREKFKNCLCQDCLINKIELLLPDCAPTEN